MADIETVPIEEDDQITGVGTSAVPGEPYYDERTGEFHSAPGDS